MIVLENSIFSSALGSGKKKWFFLLLIKGFFGDIINGYM